MLTADGAVENLGVECLGRSTMDKDQRRSPTTSADKGLDHSPDQARTWPPVVPGGVYNLGAQLLWTSACMFI
ncbi:hypothetical protein ASD54_21940 [Rhizobium sp. Root149]|nr:hypothetical protein ASD54_21940 [Rhizobium sp. Root149]